MTGLTFEQLLFLLQGTGWTLALSLMGFVGGTVIGLPIALARSSKSALLRRLSSLYVQFIQGIPLPIIMFVVYFGVSIYGFDVSALIAASIAMTLYSSAYLGEIWKGSLQAVPRTQHEAAACLALSRGQQFIYVILPQALKIAVPPTVGFMVQIVKNSSYSVVIGFFDLTYSAKVLNNATFTPFLIFSIAAALYFAICFPLSLLAARFERKLSRSAA
ncbi:amino acid ABC transporter permease [Paracoccus sp. (in: a-proteobacteria)]|uniref:amino acid ABC transporter permease n=1 Tax=Paracoccus sp. TaxID=267 RepID=UPI00289E71A2|nr:amino acid ABC transporter permease [Paracoccus sp. (in: a-proteobacteria)]